MSADVIKESSFPLQRSHSESVSDKSRVSFDKTTKKHEHRRPTDVCEVTSSASNELHDSVDGVNSKCYVVKEEGSSSRSHKHKHKRPAEVREVNKPGSNDFCDNNVSDKCRKVKDSSSSNKCRKQKHKRTADINDVNS